MKKNLFFYVFAVLCTMPFFTSCSDDDDPVETVSAADSVIGDYQGNLSIALVTDGVSVPTGDAISQTISVAKAGDNAVDLQITDFTFMEMPIGNIALENCQLTSAGDNTYHFTATSNLAVAGMLEADIDATGTFENGKLNLDLNIDNVSLLGNPVSYTVEVTYEGTKAAN